MTTAASAARRLGAVEAGLDPLSAVLLWLDEAHAAGSLAAHVRAVHEGSATSPYRDIPERVGGAARRASPDRTRDGLDRAERRAVGDALVLVGLALLLRTTTMALVREGWLRLAALRWEWVARSLDTDLDDPPDALDDHHRMMVSWARRFDALRTDLAAHDSARECLEARHLGGHTTLFPDDEAERRELLDATGRMAAMAALGPAPGPHEAVVAATADALLAQARAGALDLLGRHSEAGDVIAGMLWDARR